MGFNLSGYFNWGSKFHPYQLKLQSLLEKHAKGSNREYVIHPHGLSGDGTENMINRLEKIIEEDPLQGLSFDYGIVLAGLDSQLLISRNKRPELS